MYVQLTTEEQLDSFMASYTAHGLPVNELLRARKVHAEYTKVTAKITPLIKRRDELTQIVQKILREAPDAIAEAEGKDWLLRNNLKLDTLYYFVPKSTGKILYGRITEVKRYSGSNSYIAKMVAVNKRTFELLDVKSLQLDYWNISTSLERPVTKPVTKSKK